MTGHASNNQSRHMANPGLDQLAAQIGRDRKGRNPHLVALEGIEQQLLRQFINVYPGNNYPDAGAAALIFGQLLMDLVTKLPPEQQRQAPSIIINVLRMCGERIYTGNLPTPAIRCPFPYANGLPCKYLGEAEDTEKLNAVMRAHVGLHHPDHTWPCQHPERISLEGDHEMCSACRALVPADQPKCQHQHIEAVDTDNWHCVDCAAGGTYGEDGSLVEDVFGRSPTDEPLDVAGEEAKLREQLAPLRAVAERAGCAHPVEDLRIVDGHTWCFACGNYLGPVRGLPADLADPIVPTPSPATEGIQRTDPGQCQHPKHHRLRLPGGERCSACGQPVQADAEDGTDD